MAERPRMRSINASEITPMSTTSLIFSSLQSSAPNRPNTNLASRFLSESRTRQTWRLESFVQKKTRQMRNTVWFRTVRAR